MTVRPAVILLAIATALASCHTEISLAVQRDAPHQVAVSPDVLSGPSSGAAWPRTPLLNRFDLIALTRPLIDAAGDFVDAIASRPCDPSDGRCPTWAELPSRQLAALAALVGRDAAMASLAAHLDATDPGPPVAATWLAPAPCSTRARCSTLQVAAPGRLCAPTFVRFVAADGSLGEPVPVADARVDVPLDVQLDRDPGAGDRGTAAVRLSCLASLSQPLFSFVHLTDVQLREARAKLGTARQSRGLDHFVDSFEHDFEGELFLDVVLAAVVATINKTVAGADCSGVGASDPFACPRFAIHTGDAIDAGLRSELSTFHRIMDELTVPWLSVVGNHDVLAFGNFLPGQVVTTETLLRATSNRVPTSWYWPLLRWAAQADWKLSTSIDQSRCRGCGDALVASAATGAGFAAQFLAAHRQHPAGAGPAYVDAAGRTTFDHGFDLGGNGRGFYTFEIATTPRRVTGVVLNTSDFSDAGDARGGEGGMLSRVQLAWLEQLARRLEPDQLVLVFGHHPLDTIRDDGGRARVARVLERLAARRQLIAYFAGHTHRNHVAMHHDGHGGGFWEVETSSLIGFPQEARWVTVRQLSRDIGVLELVPFGHGFVLDGRSSFVRLLERAERGARRDRCRHHACIDGEPSRDDGAGGAVRLFFWLPRSGS